MKKPSQLQEEEWQKKCYLKFFSTQDQWIDRFCWSDRDVKLVDAMRAIKLTEANLREHQGYVEKQAGANKTGPGSKYNQNLLSQISTIEVQQPSVKQYSTPQSQTKVIRAQSSQITIPLPNTCTQGANRPELLSLNDDTNQAQSAQHNHPIQGLNGPSMEDVLQNTAIGNAQVATSLQTNLPPQKIDGISTDARHTVQYQQPLASVLGASPLQCIVEREENKYKAQNNDKSRVKKLEIAVDDKGYNSVVRHYALTDWPNKKSSFTVYLAAEKSISYILKHFQHWFDAEIHAIMLMSSSPTRTEFPSSSGAPKIAFYSTLLFTDEKLQKLIEHENIVPFLMITNEQTPVSSLQVSHYLKSQPGTYQENIRAYRQTQNDTLFSDATYCVVSGYLQVQLQKKFTKTFNETNQLSLSREIKSLKVLRQVQNAALCEIKAQAESMYKKEQEEMKEKREKDQHVSLLVTQDNARHEAQIMQTQHLTPQSVNSGAQAHDYHAQTNKNQVTEMQQRNQVRRDDYRYGNQAVSQQPMSITQDLQRNDEESSDGEDGWEQAANEGKRISISEFASSQRKLGGNVDELIDFGQPSMSTQTRFGAANESTSIPNTNGLSNHGQVDDAAIQSFQDEQLVFGDFRCVDAEIKQKQKERDKLKELFDESQQQQIMFREEPCENYSEQLQQVEQKITELKILRSKLIDRKPSPGQQSSPGQRAPPSDVPNLMDEPIALPLPVDYGLSNGQGLEQQSQTDLLNWSSANRSASRAREQQDDQLQPPVQCIPTQFNSQLVEHRQSNTELRVDGVTSLGLQQNNSQSDVGVGLGVATNGIVEKDQLKVQLASQNEYQQTKPPENPVSRFTAAGYSAKQGDNRSLHAAQSAVKPMEGLSQANASPLQAQPAPAINIDPRKRRTADYEASKNERPTIANNVQHQQRSSEPHYSPIPTPYLGGKDYGRAPQYPNAQTTYSANTSLNDRYSKANRAGGYAVQNSHTPDYRPQPNSRASPQPGPNKPINPTGGPWVANPPAPAPPYPNYQAPHQHFDTIDVSAMDESLHCIPHNAMRQGHYGSDQKPRQPSLYQAQSDGGPVYGSVNDGSMRGGQQQGPGQGPKPRFFGSLQPQQYASSAQSQHRSPMAPPVKASVMDLLVSQGLQQLLLNAPEDSGTLNYSRVTDKDGSKHIVLYSQDKSFLEAMQDSSMNILYVPSHTREKAQVQSEQRGVGGAASTASAIAGQGQGVHQCHASTLDPTEDMGTVHSAQSKGDTYVTESSVLRHSAFTNGDGRGQHGQHGQAVAQHLMGGFEQQQPLKQNQLSIHVDEKKAFDTYTLGQSSTPGNRDSSNSSGFVVVNQHSVKQPASVANGQPQQQSSGDQQRQSNYIGNGVGRESSSFLQRGENTEGENVESDQDAVYDDTMVLLRPVDKVFKKKRSPRQAGRPSTLNSNRYSLDEVRQQS